MSAETAKLFKNLLRELRPLFKEHGFRASSQNFILESTECWVIINFQKSSWAKPDETTFYVNVAACTKRYMGIKGKPADKVPPHYACDWRWRVEDFGPDKHIHDWTLRNDESLQQALGYLRTLFREFLFPATATMTTEADLMRHSGWLQYPELKTRSVIMAATGQIDDLRQTVSTLLEKFSSGVVAQGLQEHLTMLRQKYPEAMRSIERDGDPS